MKTMINFFKSNNNKETKSANSHSEEGVGAAFVVKGEEWEELGENELLGVIGGLGEEKYNNKKYEEMLIYIEAEFSGSLFGNK